MTDTKTTDGDAQDRGERRAQTARDHDDSELIERAEQEFQPDQQSRSGGEVNRKLGTRDERKRVEDPDTQTSVKQSDERADVKANERPGSV